MARIDEGKWLGADEQHREWGVRFRFHNGRVAVTALSEEREFVQSRAEWYAGIEDSDAPDGAEVAAVWRQVGPWQTGEPPVDNAASEPMGLYDRIEAALKESRGEDLDDQTVAVMAAVSRHERAKVANGEPTLFEAPDDDRAERLLANRLSELTGLAEGQCRTLSYALTHTLAVDGFVLGRRRSAAGDGQESERHATKSGGKS